MLVNWMYAADDVCVCTVDTLCVYVMSGPQYQQTGPDDVRYLRGHKLALTCVAVDDKHIYTGSKDCSIVKCELEHGYTYIDTVHVD